MLPIQKMLITMNYSQGVSIVPQYIVIHETDNEDNGANAMANRNYFANHSEAQASTHFVVDDHSIIQCAELNWKCWHVGDNRGYSDITNGNSIGIEICVNSDGNYSTARQNAIELVKYLLQVTGLSNDRIKRHRDASGKYCPRKMLDNPVLWADFLAQIKGQPSIPSFPKQDEFASKVEKARVFVGSRALELQQKLNKVMKTTLSEDGIIGVKSYGALIAFQQKYLPDEVDGLAGNHVFEKLGSIIAEMDRPQPTPQEIHVDNSPSIREIQHQFNVQLGVGIAEDNIYGQQTQGVANNCIVKYGASGEITRWIQRKLNAMGYNCGSPDGDFGNNTLNAIKRLQRDYFGNGQDDGIVGKNTWKVLLTK